MTTFSIKQNSIVLTTGEAALLRLAFADPAPNDVIVRDVDVMMRDLKSTSLTGGRLLLLNGAASLPVIAVIVHHVAHLFAVVAIYDPKLSAYVVVLSHEPDFRIGDILRESPGDP